MPWNLVTNDATIAHIIFNHVRLTFRLVVCLRATFVTSPYNRNFANVSIQCHGCVENLLFYVYLYHNVFFRRYSYIECCCEKFAPQIILEKCHRHYYSWQTVQQRINLSAWGIHFFVAHIKHLRIQFRIK